MRKRPRRPPLPLHRHHRRPKSGIRLINTNQSSRNGPNPTPLCPQQQSPSRFRSRLRFLLLRWWWTNGARRRLRIGLARLPRPLLPPNGEAESPNRGIKRKQIYPSDFFPSSASIFPSALYPTYFKEKTVKNLTTLSFSFCLLFKVIFKFINEMKHKP